MVAHIDFGAIPTSLPLPIMSAQSPHTTQGYLLHALTMGMEMAISYLTSINITTREQLTTIPTLLPTPDRSYIISHLRKDTSSQMINFVISLARPQAYAIPATIDTMIKIRLTTIITIAGSRHQQIANIQLNPCNNSILRRANPTSTIYYSEALPPIHGHPALTSALPKHTPTLCTHHPFAGYGTTDTATS